MEKPRMICSFVPRFLSQTTFVAAQVKGFAPPKSDAMAACFSLPYLKVAKKFCKDITPTP
jgi:hypothetical protein